MDHRRPPRVSSIRRPTPRWTTARTTRSSPAVNATAVGHLAAACNEASAQLVQISTDYVFGRRCGTSLSGRRPRRATERLRSDETARRRSGALGRPSPDRPNGVALRLRPPLRRRHPATDRRRCPTLRVVADQHGSPDLLRRSRVRRSRSRGSRGDGNLPRGQHRDHDVARFRGGNRSPPRSRRRGRSGHHRGVPETSTPPALLGLDTARLSDPRTADAALAGRASRYLETSCAS